MGLFFGAFKKQNISFAWELCVCVLGRKISISAVYMVVMIIVIISLVHTSPPLQSIS